MNERYSISTILPAYNEEGNIEKVIEETAIFFQNQDICKDYEIIVVDDGSRDNTAKILRELKNKNPYLKVITHCKNLGYGKVLMSGVENSRYPLILFMDADGQFEIREVEEMLNCSSAYDIIMGYRYKRKDPFYRIILGKIYTLLAFLLFGLKFKDINCGFKLFKRETIIEDSYRFNGGVFYTEVLLKAKNRGLRIKEVPVEHFPRLKGKQTGASLKVILNAAIGIIKLFILQCIAYSDKVKGGGGL